MTQRESGKDFDPKHRIVGAIVVVALAVIFIPIILNDREPPDEQPDVQVVAPGESASERNKVAVTKLSPPEKMDEPSKTPASTAPETEKTDSAPPPKTVAPTTSAKTPPASPTTVPPSGADVKQPSSGWVVQVGTFSNTANATRLEQKLRARGQPLLVERISLDGNTAVRLRVGPFRDRATATKEQQRIRKEVGVKGVVLAYP